MLNRTKTDMTMAKVASMARSHTTTAINTLAKIMAADDAPHMARIKSCEILLNRGWGMPKQDIQHSGEINGRQISHIECIIVYPDGHRDRIRDGDDARIVSVDEVRECLPAPAEASEV